MTIKADSPLLTWLTTTRSMAIHEIPQKTRLDDNSIREDSTHVLPKPNLARWRGSCVQTNLFDCVKCYPSRRNADGVSWNHLSAEKRTQFSKAIETEGQGVLVFTAVTIIDSTQVDVIREKQRDRVMSSRTCPCAGRRQTLVTSPRPDGACMVLRILTSTIPSVGAHRQNCRPSTLHYRSWRRQLPKVPRPTGRKHSCKAIRVYEMNRCTQLRLPKGCQVYRREH